MVARFWNLYSVALKIGNIVHDSPPDSLKTDSRQIVWTGSYGEVRYSDRTPCFYLRGYPECPTLTVQQLCYALQELDDSLVATVLTHLIQYVNVTECFEVTPLEDVISVEQYYETAAFKFMISPWPPPYKGSNNDSIYTEVVLQFWRDDEQTGLPRTEMCSVRFYKGAYDEDTGNCTTFDERMYPYDPATPNGVYFRFDPILWDDRGQYSLTIEYAEPDIHSPILLNVLVEPKAPNITTEPDKFEFIENEKVALICKVRHCNPQADLEWTRGMSHVLHPNPEDYHKATDYAEYSSSILRFNVKQSDHGEVYVCWTKNDYHDSSSASIALNVLFKPQMTMSPCNHDVCTYFVVEGSKAHFQCIISANPDFGSIMWYNKTGNAPEFEEIPNMGYNATAYSTPLPVTRDESGSFKCSTTNTIGDGEGQCHLDVQYGPTAEIPESVEVVEGSDWEMVCKAESNPPPDYFQWLRESDGSQIIEGQKINISNVEPKHADHYTCEVRNTLTPTGSSTKVHTDKKKLQLFVLFTPRHHQFSLTKFTGRSGLPVFIYCDVYAYPSVSIEWQYNGQIISSNEHRNVSQDGNLGAVEIFNVGEQDFGSYQCIAKNSQAEVTLDLHLLSPGKPDPPQNCTVYNVTDYITNLICIPGYDGGEELNTYVEAEIVRNSHISTVQSSVSWSHDRKEMIVTVDDLNPHTEYKLHIYSENIHGISDGKLEVAVTTADGSGNPNPPPGDNIPSVGLIIGSTMALLFLLVILVGLGLVVLWRYGVEPSCARAAQEKAKMPYLSLPKKEQSYGHLNKAYTTGESSNRNSAIANEYMPTPGMVLQEDGSIPMTNISNGRNKEVMNKANVAYEQRQYQSHLAGRGALNYNSNQNIPVTMSLASDSGNRPKSKIQIQQKQHSARPPTIGSSCTALDHWEFPRTDLYIKQKLGEGAFGEVWRGTAHNIADIKGKVAVAVKFLREGSPPEENQTLEKELKLMKTIQPHPNVIQLLGCCTNCEPLYIIMEFVANGNLQQYLRDQRGDAEYSNIHDASSLTTKGLIIFSLHVVSGMEYISSLGYIHRDLAARNILVDGALTCKISDFGLARDIVNCRMYESKTQRRLPIRWMAPESLFDSLYTTKSDTWAFGVLLWEIVTLGSTPYPGLTGPDIMELIKTGYRMDKPRHCSRTMYDIMRNCWQHEAKNRPTFTALRQELEQILWNFESSPNNDIHVEQMQENLFQILSNPPGEKC